MLLNASYEPLRIVSWQKAFILVFQQKVEVLEEYGAIIRTVSDEFRVPAVLRLRHWVRLRRRNTLVRFSRANLYARDGYRCQYCDEQYSERELTLDHVVPVAKGGKKSWENIVTACLDCNQKKGHKSLMEMGYTLKKKPTAPNWLPGTVGSVRTRTVSPIWEPYLPHTLKRA